MQFTSTMIKVDYLEAMAKIPDRSIDFICADFPYNISGKGGVTIQKDKVVPVDFGDWDKWDTQEEYFNFVFNVCDEYKRIIKPNASLVLFFSYFTGGWIAHELERRKVFSFKSPLIFTKENPLPSIKKQGFRSCFEWAGWFVNNQYMQKYHPRVFNFLGQKEMKNVMSYRIGPRYKRSPHPTEKPEHLIKKLIEIFTNPGDIVLDSFAGGGTTAAACMATGRSFMAIERDPRYFSMMKSRLGL